MARFRTTDGVEWDVRINVLAIKRVEEETGIRLTAIVDDEAVRQAVLGDDLRFVDIVIALLRPQMEQAKRSMESVLEVMDATTLEQAVAALMEAIFDFFPEPRKGLLVKAWGKTRAAMEKLDAARAAAVSQRIDAIDVEVELLRFPTTPSTPTNSASSLQASAG